jgi:hypothetical protein
MKSLAAMAYNLQAPFVVGQIELPQLQDTGSLVRIVGVGVSKCAKTCHSSC